MKRLFLPFTAVFLLFSFQCWGESIDELVQRDGVYYEKFKDEPFNGKVKGKANGNIINGKKDGLWLSYHDNGQLDSKGEYKNGEMNGAWVYYHNNGILIGKGNWHKGKRDGLWERYYNNGRLWYKGQYNKGVQHGHWATYEHDGQLTEKGHYQNGKKEGAWVTYAYSLNGALDSKLIDVFENGIKVDD